MSGQSNAQGLTVAFFLPPWRVTDCSEKRNPHLFSRNDLIWNFLAGNCLFVIVMKFFAPLFSLCVHLLFSTMGKVTNVPWRSSMYYTTMSVCMYAPVHQYFLFPLFFAVGPCLFLFFLNVTGSTRFFFLYLLPSIVGSARETIWPFSGIRLTRAIQLTHDDHLYIVLLFSQRVALLVDLYVFMYVKDFFDRTLTTYERSVEI